MSRKNILWLYGTLFIFSLFLRLAVAGFANCGEIKTVRPDTDGYLAPARSLVERGGYESTRRPPGFPILAAAVFKSGGEERALSYTLAALSALTVLAVARAGFLYGGHKIAVTAGILYALNPTVLGNAPLLLTDTLAGLFVAFQYWFFLEFYRKKKSWGFFGCAFTAGLGVLIRPINSLFILPLIFLLCFMPEISWKKKFAFAASGALLFFAPFFPWMLRNASQGAGFCVDTNTGAMYHQNGAMLLGEVTGRGYEFEKQRILAEQEELFKDKVRFPDEKSREVYRIGKYKELVKNHFALWLKQQMNYQILLPDLPSLLECLGVTSSDRGTMAILKEQGIMAAVRHYFGANWFFIMLLLLPLTGIALLTYLGSGIYLLHALRYWKKYYMEIFIFGAFVSYYLFLPGAITAPRYQIPALPCLAVDCAWVLIALVKKIRNGRRDDEISGNNEAQKAGSGA